MKIKTVTTLSITIGTYRPTLAMRFLPDLEGAVSLSVGGLLLENIIMSLSMLLVVVVDVVK